VSDDGGGTDSQLRLFLSVDILGSTALKGEANYQTISAHLRMLEKAVGKDAPDNLPASALPSLDEYDWVAIQQNTFGDFHSDFSKSVQSEVTSPYEIFPWKALGDELIYSIRLESRESAARFVTRFIASLRLIDGRLASKGRIRLKGTAWIAGFPIRNRVVQIPGPTLFYKQGLEDVLFPYPKEDFWGPDMDIGFRLSRCTFPGMCVASAGLVELVAEAKSNDQVRFAHVGWEKLKGVWNERPYPVFWAELPTTSEADATNVVLAPWADGEGSFVARWNAPGSKLEAKSHLKLLVKLREALPANFGLIKPYIPEEDGVPAEHQQILDLVKKLPKGAAAEQDADEGPGSHAPERPAPSLEPLMKRLVEILFVNPDELKPSNAVSAPGDPSEPTTASPETPPRS
jgi:hypothetical protein